MVMALMTCSLSSRILLHGDGVDDLLLETFVLRKLTAASLVKKFHEFSGNPGLIYYCYLNVDDYDMKEYI